MIKQMKEAKVRDKRQPNKHDLPGIYYQLKSHTSTTPELHEEQTKYIQSLNDEVNISLYETGEVLTYY